MIPRVSNTPRHLSWLLCIHNIPPKPPYLRAKVSRRLAALGAVAVKNSVYVLPDGAQQRDGLLWLSKEIEEGGGRAYVCGASFNVIDGGNHSDTHVKKLFMDARKDDYQKLAEEFTPKLEILNTTEVQTDELVEQAQIWTGQLRRRYERILSIDFFGSSSRGTLEGLLAGFERWVRQQTTENDVTNQLLSTEEYKHRTWVTRPCVHVDRIASAWFIKRFIDSEAILRFDTEIQAKEIRYDMTDAEFTHEGKLCTFEVMVRRFGLESDSSIMAISQIVHDIDLHENVSSRDESAGIAALLNGLCLRIETDEERIASGFHLLDNLHEHFRQRDQDI